MKVSVDTEEMHAKCCEIRNICSELNSNMDQIESAVLSIGNEWQGESERAFVAKIIYVRQQFSGITKFLEDYADILDTFSYKYEEHDKDLSLKINLA